MALLRTGELVDGRYEVRALLGQGGMGAVYRALDRARAVEVALKVVRPEWANEVDLRRFLREGELAARVDRLGGVARVHAAGAHAGAPYYVMELVPGRELGGLLAEGALDERSLAAVVEGVARTLAACHDAGIVHRDVKPSNIVVSEGGPPRLLDFGLARDVRRDTHLTATGEVVGTPAYMAPEQANGALVDARADVYALGAILYHALAGRPPFAGAIVQLLHQKLTSDPPRPSSLRERGAVSAPLEAICLRAMARSADERYASAQALADDLARWQRGEVPLAAARGGAGRVAVVGLTLVLAVALVAGALGWRTLARRDHAAALERALEWDGARCLAAPSACTGGPHVLVRHALGLGGGPAPSLADVDARVAALGATPEAAGARDRLQAWGRLLDHARPPAAGPTGDLVEALCALEAGHLDEVRPRLVAATTSPVDAPELPLVLARVAVEALRRGPDDPAVATLLTSSFAAGDVAAVDSTIAGPGLVDARLAALADDAAVARWVDALHVRRGMEAVPRHLRALTTLLAWGPRAPDVERAWLARLGARLGATLAADPIDDDELERALQLERALRALAPRLAPWTLDEVVDERIRRYQDRGVDVPTRLIVAALGVGSRMSKGLANDVDLTNLEGLLPPTSRALRYVRFTQLREKDASLRYLAAREVLQGTDDDLGPSLLAAVCSSLVDGAGARLESAPGTLTPEDVAEALAVAATFRRLAEDFPGVAFADVTTTLRAELRVRCGSAGWSSAPEVVATLDRWLDERVASPGARGPDEWIAQRPKVWIGWVHALSVLDLSTQPTLADLAERLARGAIECRDVGTTDVWQARGLLVRVLRVRGELAASEQLVREHLDPATWSYPLFPAEAVRTLIAVDLDLAERVFADAQPLFGTRTKDYAIELATRELAAARAARPRARGTGR